ncbi:MAG: hypothetical protein HY775_06330 [Acidobacteria bacterium]|nr:hypothetical protein [Acidobacteriota bacterium]
MEVAEGVRVPEVSDGVIVPVVDPATGPFYLDVRDLASADYGWAIYVYMETNGVAGLQRGGMARIQIPPLESYDGCLEDRPRDMLIF